MNENKKKYTATFYSPGTFVAETSVKELKEDDPKEAAKLADEIEARHGAHPYGFKIETFLVTGPVERDGVTFAVPPKLIDTSPFYFWDCDIVTLEELVRENDPDNKILISNMRRNGWGRVAQPRRGWRWSQPFEDNDVALDRDGQKMIL